MWVRERTSAVCTVPRDPILRSMRRIQLIIATSPTRTTTCLPKYIKKTLKKVKKSLYFVAEKG
jgi:hypothetical protein